MLLLIRYTDEITDAGLSAFSKKFFDGELVPTLKSEEPADEDLAEPVKVVKGKSFSKMVLENGEALWRMRNFRSFCVLAGDSEFCFSSSIGSNR